MFSFIQKIRLVPGSPVWAKALYTIALLLLLSALSFSVFYCLSGYEYLMHWYYAINNCFYEKETWATTFFTPAVKAKGNYLAIAGSVISIAGIGYVIRHWRKHTDTPPAKKNRWDTSEWKWYAVVGFGAMAMGIYEWLHISPAYDEVFSAVHCAELPAFQLISYYMLPNNHIFFNLVNHVLFGWYGDLVISGRLISLLAYIAAMMCIFHWLNKLIQNRFFALIALLPVALQLTTLGFAPLARGYEWQLLSGWVAFISLLNYIKTSDALALRTNLFFNIIGFILIPSYLYFYLPQVVFVAAILLYQRRLKLKYWKYQLALICVVFLFYLPAFCFSGVASFTDNKYVKPAADIASFLPYLAIMAKDYVGYCFSYLFGENSVINFILFFLPLLLFFSKQRERKLLALFYSSLWITYMALTLKMRHVPYQRTINVQYSITMACVAYTFFILVNGIAGWFKNNSLNSIFRSVCFCLPLIFFCGHLLQYNKDHASYQLFGYDINATYNRNMEQIHLVPRGSSIAFSNVSFYLFYIYRREHYEVSRCADGHEDYYIKFTGEDEPVPIEKNSNYILYTKDITDYEVYKRK